MEVLQLSLCMIRSWVETSRVPSFQTTSKDLVLSVITTKEVRLLLQVKQGWAPTFLLDLLEDLAHQPRLPENYLSQ